MLVDRKTQAKIEAFQKYASFIADKFGVVIRMDGSRAETDGNTIFIPSIAGMEQEEINFLRSIILHEVGHVKYTPFDVTSQNRYKSDAHFRICNALEDARIENLMMKEFDGAHDIFHNLYNVYMMDERFMNRVFGGSLKNSDTFHLITCYLHDMMVNLDNCFSFMKLIKKTERHAVKNFIEKNKIEEIASQHPLKTHNDVCNLADKIYDILFKSNKDNSSTTDLNKIQDMIDNAIKNDVPVMQKEAEELQVVLNKKAQDIYAEQKQLETIEDAFNTFRKTIKPELDTMRSQQKKLSETIRIKKKIESKGKKVRSAKNALNKKLDKINKEQDKIDEIARQLNELEPESKESKKLIEKSHKASARQEKHYPAIKKLRAKLEDTQNNYDKAEKALEKVPSDLAQQTKSDLIDQYKNIMSRKQVLRDQLDALAGDVSNQQNKINNMAHDYFLTKDAAGKKIANQMKSIEDNLHKQGVPSKIMPEFKSEENWTEADKMQKQFDQHATKETGDVVTNGHGFCKKETRDIMALIDKTKNDLSSIDLSKHFQDRHNDNKLKSFNDTISEINNTEIADVEDGVCPINRTHVPLTTAYDVIKIENTSDGKILDEVKRNHGRTIAQVKNVFRQRLRFQKKDRWKGNQEEGGLDARSLWKIATKHGDDRLFEINDPKLINKITASVVLDVSGSMDKNDDAAKLREMALFISEGLNECFIKHEIVGYHAPVCEAMKEVNASDVYNRSVNNLETIIYKKFDDKGNKGIQNVKVHASDNSDGESLRIAGERLMKQRSKRRVMFICTDSKPFLSEANIGMLDNHLMETIKWLKENRIELYAFGFNDYGKKFFGDRFCHVKSYNDFLQFCMAKLS